LTGEGAKALTVYAQPGREGAKLRFKARNENRIGGEWVPPGRGRFVKNITPVTGRTFTKAARGTAEDVELALDAAHKAAPAWGRTPPAERALVLNRIADRFMDNPELLALAQTWDNGRPIRQTPAADIPLASGIGRQNHLMMLDHHQQTKNLLVSHSEDKQGFF
jgi:aldehyde dehydrogenase